MTQIYKYKAGRIKPKLPAQMVGEELERIREDAGSLTPQNVVDASRPSEALLHEECDLHIPADERAERWSRHKARNIINVVTIELPTAEGKPAPIQAFVNTVEGKASKPESRTYEPVEDILADPEKRAKLVQRCLEKLLRVQREFRHLQELSVVWNAIDEARMAHPVG